MKSNLVLLCTMNKNTVSLVVPRVGPEGTVDRDLVPVGPQSMSVGVVVGEKTTLQHLVWAEMFPLQGSVRKSVESPRLNTRHQVSGTEGDLLDLSKVVPRVPVESDPADRDQRELPVRPNLGQVERVEAPILGLFEGHDLNGH